MSTVDKSLLCLLCMLLLAPLQTYGACHLPIPDGGDEGYIPSEANLFGDIVRVKLPLVTLKDPRLTYLSAPVIGFVGDPGDPPGEWLVRITLKDQVRHVAVPLKTSFVLLGK